MATETLVSLKDFKSDVHIDWCPGCGDFGIVNAVQMALYELRLPRHEYVIFSGIGCSGKTPHYVNTYGIHTLHGRSIPFATGARLANPHLKVVVVGGDGDGMGIGAGHFVNAGRRNINLTYIIHDNGVYGLTKGQASPTLHLGVQTKSLPKPNIQSNINPLILAFACGYTFIARGYSYDVKGLKELIKQGIQHEGLAFIDVLQPCPTYNNINTKEWFSERIYNLGPEYDPAITPETPPEEVERKIAAFVERATEWETRIPVGVFLKNTSVPCFEERIRARIPNYFEYPPATRPVADDLGRPLQDIRRVLEGFRVT
ncbi:MAG: 2-oxoacid:ferredoxin oxidoreductase subunit beta [bacterium JZ-2024 1]